MVSIHFARRIYRTAKGVFFGTITVSALIHLLYFPGFYADSSDSGSSDNANYSTAAILQMVPPVFHKYLTGKPRNSTHGKHLLALPTAATPIRRSAMLVKVFNTVVVDFVEPSPLTCALCCQLVSMNPSK